MPTLPLKKALDRELHNVKHPPPHPLTPLSLCPNAFINHIVISMPRPFQEKHVTSKYYKKDPIIHIILLRNIQGRYFI